jgi:hypothetical protein
MEGLKSFYNRSRIEYDDFRRVFNFKTLDQIKEGGKLKEKFEDLCKEFKVVKEEVLEYE